MESNKISFSRTYFKLLRYRKIVEIYRRGYKVSMSKVGFWREYVVPEFPCSYYTFRNALEESNIAGKINALEEQGFGFKRREPILKNQLELELIED